MFRIFRNPTITNNAAKFTTRMQSSRTVLNMPAKVLSTILQNPEQRALYQVVDVREISELQTVKLPDNDVIHLPLSESNQWAEIVKNHPTELEEIPIDDDESTGKKVRILRRDKPVVCFCHHGMRSMRVAEFLGTIYFFLSFAFSLISSMIYFSNLSLVFS
jgi:rhodanese-related sulfurtransferase